MAMPTRRAERARWRSWLPQPTQGNRTIQTPGRPAEAIQIRSPPIAQKVRRAISSSPLQSGSRQSSDEPASAQLRIPQCRSSTGCCPVRFPRRRETTAWRSAAKQELQQIEEAAHQLRFIRWHLHRFARQLQGIVPRTRTEEACPRAVAAKADRAQAASSTSPGSSASLNSRSSSSRCRSRSALCRAASTLVRNSSMV